MTPSCAHPDTPENRKPNGRGGFKCRECSNASYRKGNRERQARFYKLNAASGVGSRGETRRPLREETPSPAPYVSRAPRRFSWEKEV